MNDLSTSFPSSFSARILLASSSSTWLNADQLLIVQSTNLSALSISS